MQRAISYMNRNTFGTIVISHFCVTQGHLLFKTVSDVTKPLLSLNFHLGKAHTININIYERLYGGVSLCTTDSKEPCFMLHYQPFIFPSNGIVRKRTTWK